ncbi:RNA-directed DNA polymerase, eukaryota, reverse transcriptase zinc-binding domain protein [Tanacetum coccineum]
MSKLDRFLISDNLMCVCPTISSISLDRYLSVHRPILMREIYCDYGPSPFKFYHYWFIIDSFDKLVEDSWKEANICENNDSIKFMKKLRFLKEKIRKWNCLYKERKNCGMRNLKIELNSLDSVIDRGDGTDSVTNRRMEVVRLIQEMEKAENLEVAQKAKIKWAIEGDENSKYYHGVLNKKRGRLAIRGVLADGIVTFRIFRLLFASGAIDRGDGTNYVTNRRMEVVRLIQEMEKDENLEVAQKAKIKWAIEGDENSKYYHGVLNKKRGRLAIRGIRLEMDFVNRITSDQNETLEGEVTNEEVKKAVWDCGVDKAPGPDGFTFGFYRRYWNLIESDVVNAVKWFFIHGSIPKGGDLVNEIQSAFMTDRQILDGPFILNELVQWCKKRKKQVMFFNVDFEKAYDSVRWEFLDDILKKFGFCEKWCNWIQSCLQSSRGSVLVNGSPTQEFQFYKGLKQGDPLSPFLFILVMESLHISFQRVMDAGLFKGIKMGSSLQISHLFYADDAIFMGHWNQSNISTITRVLDVFHRASGLRINMNKSKLMGISVDDSVVEQAAAKIGCVVLKTPFKYLGSRVGGLMSRVQSWNEIIEGMEARLSRWKLKTLSIGGRLTLLKSVLGAIHIYHMSMFKVPMQVLQKLESIRARFFNGADVNSRKPSWVRWKNVMASKASGGLGVSSLFALNRALMFKWVWRFISQKNSLWARVITALHGEGGKIGKLITSTYPSIWLSIVQEVETLKRQGIDLMSFITPSLGNGLDTSFGDVPWRGDIAFKELAPRIYALESMKRITVALKLSHGGLEHPLRRYPRGGAEQVQLDLIQEKIEGCILSNSKDRWSWSLDGVGDFTVASVRKAIDDHILPTGNTNTRWVKEVPIKINIHAWKVKNDCFPTRFNMSRRGMEIDTILCPLCNRTAESSRHLFFSCQFIRDIMHKIIRWWELDHREIDSYDDWLEWVTSIRLPIKVKKVFEGICYIVCRYTWNWRNKKIFGHDTHPKASIFDEIV